MFKIKYHRVYLFCMEEIKQLVKGSICSMKTSNKNDRIIICFLLAYMKINVPLSAK